MSSILMNRTRSQIIRFLLRNGPSTCSRIGRELHASESNVRRHLGLLRDAGLVQHSSASSESVQRHVAAVAVSFQVKVMPTRKPAPMS